MVRNLVEVVIAQYGEYRKHHWVIHLKMAMLCVM